MKKVSYPRGLLCFIVNIIGPLYEVSVLITYAQMFLIYAHAAVSSEDRGGLFDLNVHLHLYLVYVSSEGSGEYVPQYAHTHLSFRFIAR